MPSPNPQRLFLPLFTLFCSLITCAFLAFALYGLINQYRTLSFAKTWGTIDSIERTESTDSDHGHAWGIKVAYHFRIDRKRYDATRLRFAVWSSNDTWANDMLRQFPAHSHPNIYYNPADPHESVLIAGPEGQDFFLLVFLTPFTVVMLFLWTMLLKSFLPMRSLRSFNIRKRGPILRIRPSVLLPIQASAAALAFAAFFSMFIVAFLLGGFHPTLHTMQIAWTILATIAVATALLTALLRSLGTFDITLNDTARTVTKRNLLIPYANITALHISNNGETKNQSNSFIVRIHYMQNNTPSRLTLKSWLPTVDTAARLATFLALHLRTPIYDLDENLLLPAPQPASSKT